MATKRKVRRVTKTEVVPTTDTEPISDIPKPQVPSTRLWAPFGKAFYDQPCLELCKKLLGKILVRKVNGETLAARIVEVEAYPGPQDRASHSFEGKRTSRNRAMFMDPGSAYVYFIYGMYHCFNISSKEPGSCVLLRAAEPLEGIQTMMANRVKRTTKSSLPLKHLCNGPSKLCQALDITKESCNQLDMTLCDSDLFVADCSGNDDVHDDDIVECPRIGIDSAGEPSVSKLYRFYADGSECVSVKFNPLK